MEVMGDNRHDKGWQGHHYFLKKQRKGPVFIKEIDREGNEHLVHTGHRSYDSAMRWLNRYVGQQFAEKDEHPERIPLPHSAQVHVNLGVERQRQADDDAGLGIDFPEYAPLLASRKRARENAEAQTLARSAQARRLKEKGLTVPSALSPEQSRERT